MSTEAISSSETAGTYDADLFEKEVSEWFESIKKTDNLARVYFRWEFAKKLPWSNPIKGETSLYNWPPHTGTDLLRKGKGFLRNGYSKAGQLDAEHPLAPDTYDAHEIQQLIQNSWWFHLWFEAEAFDRNGQILSSKTWEFNRAKG